MCNYNDKTKEQLKADLIKAQERIAELESANLFDNDSKFFNITDASPVPYALNDEEQNIIYLNPTFIKTFGYDLNDIPTLAEWWSRAYPDSDYQQWVAHTWQKHLNRSKQTNTTFEPIEVTVCCKDGSTRTILASAASLSGSYNDNHLVIFYDITERKETENKIKENEKKHRRLVDIDTETLRETTQNSILIADDDPTQLLLTQQALENEGYLVEAAENGAQALELFQCHQPALVLLDVLMPEMNGYEVCRAIRQQSVNSHVPILMATGLQDVDSINQAYTVGATDFVTKPLNWLILAQRVRYMLRASQAIERVQRSEEMLVNAQKIAKLGNWEWNIGTDLMQISSEMYRLLSLSPRNTSPNMTILLQAIHPDDRLSFQEIIGKVKNTHKKMYLKLRIANPEYPDRWLESQIDVIEDKSGEMLLFVGTFQDISERKKTEEKIDFLSRYDALTGLPNRKCFLEDLNKAINRARRDQEMAGILVLDIDRFKRINDSLGNDAGDTLLREFGHRLSKSVRTEDSVGRIVSSDTITVARWGGDEFAILFTGLRTTNALAWMAARLQNALQQPFFFHEQKIIITASIGIAVYPADGHDAEILLKNGDAALNHSKASGPNSINFYSESLNKSALELMTLENDLRIALKNGQFELYYQPQVHVEQKRVSGAEALIRWQHPERGLMSPFTFIPLAEETGVIKNIGEWVLNTACAQHVAWRDAGFAPVRMAVNISSIQFQQGNLVETVKKAIRKSGIDPQYLELELTESIIIDESKELIETMQQLKKLGVQLVLDDFGTGYSSLRYLKNFPIDGLKIDRSFVKDLPGDNSDAALARAIMSMAQSLNYSVVAEGVETREQFEFFVKKYCHEIQGYLFSKPVPAQEFEAILEGDLFREVIR
ncbi:MAG: EAL domain-containing protein [Desulfobulbaceae bacterium]|nr:EAL domain-containing protein [Desulfobulbaceae bacterium]